MENKRKFEDPKIRIVEIERDSVVTDSSGPGPEPQPP